MDGESAPMLSVIRRTDISTSEDARFAALVAASCIWLADPSSEIDREMLTALIREQRNVKLSEKRAEYVRLLEKAISLVAD